MQAIGKVNVPSELFLQNSVKQAAKCLQGLQRPPVTLLSLAVMCCLMPVASITLAKEAILADSGLQ